MICQKCGKEMNDRSRYCPSCKAIVGNEKFAVNEDDTFKVLHGNEEFEDDKKGVKIGAAVVSFVIGIIFTACEGGSVLIGGIIFMIVGFILSVAIIEWFQKRNMAETGYKLPVTCSPDAFELEAEKILDDYGYSARKSPLGFLVVTKKSSFYNAICNIADIVDIDVKKSVSAVGLLYDTERGYFKIIELPMNGLKRTNRISAKGLFKSTVIITCIIQRHFEGIVNG